MTSPRQSDSVLPVEIRAEVAAVRDGEDPVSDVTSVVVGEVLVRETELGPRLEIFLVPDGAEPALIFSAPLGGLAWQLALMEPKLAMWLTQE